MNNSSNSNPLVSKSYLLGLTTAKLVLKIQNDKREYVLTKQLLRSCTSVGANISEAQGAESKRDFLSKVSIAYKECFETTYWIRILKDLDFITNQDAQNLLNLSNEITRMIAKTRVTIRKSLRTNK